MPTNNDVTFVQRDRVRLTSRARKLDEYTRYLGSGSGNTGHVVCEDLDGTVLVDFKPKVGKTLNVVPGNGIMANPDAGVIWASKHDLENVEV